ncbi:dienelactone hydrolase [Herbaspirillum sp. Sphag1AN]|uniref:alpha/beta hydrolase family protein n=1 Tax=unclassified Herbaspirillum TaxID=2624150 RepID=UPI001611CCBD|nr:MULTISPECIES: alpha/beta fold hydrolase [unclassified Herbaspirillum]MBB3211680.1 dienelactone hydrolase [Herbaspirillum sp. Sphag1AN]MBB3245052.1 dienelactone hydrolase [Herbaspirillum sp. Sphag64]
MRYLLLLLSLLSLHVQAETYATDLHESVASIDVSVKDMYGREASGKVTITQFKPDGDGPFPIMILNHGRSVSNHGEPPRFRYTAQVRFFTSRGFAVFVPTRIGYGAMGTSFDPETSGNCVSPDYAPMAEAASKEILAVLDYAKQQPYVDPHRVLLVGQSVGGYTTTAAAAKNPDGLVAAINFAGGSGGDPDKHPGIPCQGQKLEEMYSHFGATTKVPMLWIYTQNDRFFNPDHSQAWHAAFVKAGGNAEYHLMPAFKENGHFLFAGGINIWSPVVAEFLGKMGFPAEPLTH